eukprot:3418197-Rhodomonas_salina.1
MHGTCLPPLRPPLPLQPPAASQQPSCCLCRSIDMRCVCVCGREYEPPRNIWLGPDRHIAVEGEHMHVLELLCLDAPHP